MCAAPCVQPLHVDRAQHPMGPHRAPVSERDRRRTPVRLHRGRHVCDPRTSKGRLGEEVPCRWKKVSFSLFSFLLLLRAAHLDPISETGSLNLFLGFSSVQVIRSGQKFSSTYVCRLVRTRPEFLRHQTDLVSFYPTRAAVCISSTSRRLYHSRIRAILPFRTCKPATRSRAGSSAIRVGRLRVH